MDHSRAPSIPPECVVDRDLVEFSDRVSGVDPDDDMLTAIHLCTQGTREDSQLLEGIDRAVLAGIAVTPVVCASDQIDDMVRTSLKKINSIRWDARGHDLAQYLLVSLALGHEPVFRCRARRL